MFVAARPGPDFFVIRQCRLGRRKPKERRLRAENYFPAATCPGPLMAARIRSSGRWAAGQESPHQRRTAMRRITFDILMATAGLFLAVTLIAAGGLLTWA